MNPLDGFLTFNELAADCKYSKKSVGDKVKKYKIAHLSIGKKMFFPPEAVGMVIGSNKTRRVQDQTTVLPSAKKLDGQRLDHEDFLYVQEVALYLSQSAKTIERWINSGRLPAYGDSGSRKHIAIADFLNFLEKCWVNRSPCRAASEILVKIPDELSCSSAEAEAFAQLFAEIVRVASKKRLLGSKNFNELTFQKSVLGIFRQSKPNPNPSL